MMKIKINGETKEVTAELNLQTLLENLELKSLQVAVELNRVIVNRDDFSITKIKEGDELEIVHFVGGG